MPRILQRAVAVTTAVALAAALIPTAQAAAAQPLSWGACPSAPGEYQCATLEVPLSYQDPAGPRIQIAVGRLPATDQSHKQGTIFYNPGGPGNPGRIPPVLTAELHRHFDLVGFDPRGVGASTTAHCFTDPSQLAILQRVAGQFPMTPAQARQQIADTLTLDNLCAQNAGPLFGHMSTANVARTWTASGPRSANPPCPTTASPTARSWARPTPTCSRTVCTPWFSTPSTTP